MSTPFEFFRRNQKVALAAVTGMAILSFLVQDAISNSGEMSPLGVGVLLIGSLTIVGWVWGAKEGKSGDSALWGAIFGAALTLGMMFMSRPPAAMSAVTGNLSAAALEERIRDQGLANRMLSNVFYSADPMRARLEPLYAQMGRSQLTLFTYDSDLKISAIISELLNREADELGIEVTDQAVMDYLKLITGKDRDGDDYLTRQLFNDAIENTANSVGGGASEETIFAALRHELRAQQTANLLLGGRRLTPVDVWDLHRKLSVRESAQVIAVPVADFVKKDAQPTDSEIQELFEKYKNNIPNFTAPPQPKLEGGRPGFYLDRRMRLAYLEPNYEEIEKQVAAVTEEDIQKRYEEQYKKVMPSDIGDGMNLDMGVLPSVPKTPAGEAKPEDGGKTESGATPPAPPASEPVGEKPAEPAKPEEPAKPAQDQPAADKPAADKPADEQPQKPAEPAKPEGSSLRLNPNSKFQPVALLQAAEAAKPTEAPAAEAPKADAPASPPPAADGKPADPAAPSTEPKPETPATEKPAAEKPAEGEPAPPTGDKPADTPLTVPPVADPKGEEDPAPPAAQVRPLDEALKQQIRQELLDERIQPLLSAKTEAARDFINDLQLRVAEYMEHERNVKAKKKSQLSDEALSPDAATAEIQKYAKEHDLSYHVTELLTIDELANSEDYPFSGSMVHDQPVRNVLFQTSNRDLFRAVTAVRMGENRANVTYWKIEDVAEHAPATIDEPGVKDAVVKAWREQKARPLAEARAKALSEIVSKSDKPMAEAVSEQTVTGDKESLFVTVNSTGEFSWLQRSSAANPFGANDSSPRLGAVNGVRGAGSKFMEKVFDEIKPGDTSVVPNEDMSIYYIVKLEKRTPSTDSEATVMKDNFLSPASNPLVDLASNAANSYNRDFKERLIAKHGVKLPSKANEDQVEN